MDRYPFAEVEAKITERITELGGRPHLNLYKTLANEPTMLKAWVEFAYSLRLAAKTPRILRELMILRTAQLQNSAYEWHQHRFMAKEVGVSEHQIADLAMWPSSDSFSPKEKAALALTEAIVQGEVSEETHKLAAAHFSTDEMIELVMTASFYTMVPRVLAALDVQIEKEE